MHLSGRRVFTPFTVWMMLKSCFIIVIYKNHVFHVLNEIIPISDDTQSIITPIFIDVEQYKMLILFSVFHIF